MGPYQGTPKIATAGVSGGTEQVLLSSEETKASTLALVISPGMGKDEFLLLNCLVLGALLCYS